MRHFQAKLVVKAATAALLACGSAAVAQSVNIDFGTPGTGPSSSYAGAGRHGAWNVIGVMPSSVRFDLVGRSGQPIVAKIYNLGGSAMLDHDNGATTGDHEALLDDMFISFNNPVDLCLYFENLLPGEYDVVLYGVTPDNAAHLNRMRVDNSTPGPTWIGGAFPGSHVEGLTFSKHRVTVTNGRINPHAGEFGANYQSGVNGVQLLYLGACPGDATADFSVNFADLNMVLSNFGAVGAPGSVPGDVNNDGQVNFGDLNIVLSEFGRLC